MTKKKILIVVEAPKKIKQFEAIFKKQGQKDGNKYFVQATIGHIMDLNKKTKTYGIDLENQYQPDYIVTEDKRKVVAQLKKVGKEVDEVWLATDLDQEGEFIAYSVCQPEVLNLPVETTKRLIFNEVTQEALTHAAKNPTTLNPAILAAQKCRRVLDRLIGFDLSKASRQIHFLLAVGRVKTIIVKLLYDYEEERKKFTAETFYRLKGLFYPPAGEDNVDNTDDTDNTIDLIQALAIEHLSTPEQVESLLQRVQASDHPFQVQKILDRPVKQNPPPPFMTSTLQKTVSRHFSISPKQVMIVSQKLYEKGLISYPRTDTTRLPDSKNKQIEEYIKEKYGDEYHKFRVFQQKKKNTQEAHAAIYPTDIKKFFPADIDGLEAKVYQMIHRRTVACQMVSAEKQKITLTLGLTNTSGEENAVDTQLKAEHEVVTFPGFLIVYQTGSDEEVAQERQARAAQLEAWRQLKVGDHLDHHQLTVTQDWTKPTARYDEAKVLDQLEKLGIGRPSTWPQMLSAVQERKYISKEDRAGESRERNIWQLGNSINTDTDTNTPVNIQHITEIATVGAEQQKLYLTDLGRLMIRFTEQYFPHIFNYQFTSELETNLGKITENEQVWHEVVDQVYQSYSKTLTNFLEEKQAQQFRVKRQLGEYNGKPAYAYVARWGPVVQLGSDPPPKVKKTKDEKKKKAPKGVPTVKPKPHPKPNYYKIDPPLTVDTVQLEHLPRLTALPRTAGNDSMGRAIIVKKGPYGAYFTYRGNNYQLRPDCFEDPEPLEATIDCYLECLDQLSVPKLLESVTTQDIQKKVIKKVGPYQIREGPKGIYFLHKRKLVPIKEDQMAELNELASNPKAAEDYCLDLYKTSLTRGKGRGRGKGKKAKATGKAPKKTATTAKKIKTAPAIKVKKAPVTKKKKAAPTIKVK